MVGALQAIASSPLMIACKTTVQASVRTVGSVCEYLKMMENDSYIVLEAFYTNRMLQVK